MHTDSIISKQDDLETHRSGIVKFTKVEISDRQIHDYSDRVVVTLKAEAAGTVDHEAFSATYRFTRIWVQRQNCWQIVADQVNLVAL